MKNQVLKELNRFITELETQRFSVLFQHGKYIRQPCEIIIEDIKIIPLSFFLVHEQEYSVAHSYIYFFDVKDIGQLKAFDYHLEKDVFFSNFHFECVGYKKVRVKRYDDDWHLSGNKKQYAKQIENFFNQFPFSKILTTAPPSTFKQYRNAEIKRIKKEIKQKIIDFYKLPEDKVSIDFAGPDIMLNFKNFVPSLRLPARQYDFLKIIGL